MEKNNFVVTRRSYDIATRITLSAVLCVVVSAFIFSLFKNIQYPLLWNDESETAMYAKRILQYGYPKLHDGKNVVWLNELPDKKTGIDKKWDTNTVPVWGQYYFAGIGAFFAEKTDDIYLKTAFLRIPFAVAGLAGLLIMVLSVITIFGNSMLCRLSFLILFFALALSSTALTMHLRELRHPALVLFLSACIFCTYFNYRYYNKLKTTQYFIGLVLFLFLLYHVFHVVCFIFFAVIGLYELIILLKERNIGRFFNNMAPIVVTFMLTIPFFIFSQTFKVGKMFMSRRPVPPWSVQALSVLYFFQRYELLYPVLAAKILFFCTRAYFFKIRLDTALSVRQKMRVSNFLSLFFISYVSVISLFPSVIIWQRYYVILIPVLAMILLLDLFGTFELLSQVPSEPIRKRIKWLCGQSSFLFYR